ncbi:MAG: hypothetical protein HQL44_13895 [Alphaproteobacteria bacterium]|nr:hypothetical protein [Alphaproteobacteria bacterium]
MAKALGPALTEMHLYRFTLCYPYFRARLEWLSGPDYAAAYPAIDKHVFNRLSPYGTDFFYYFPYAYLFRELGVGPLNEFGMRIDKKLGAFSNRASNHKLVVVYGGSAAWSLDCLHSEMFSFRLEVKLNEWAAASSRGMTFSVLNMGQHGNVVMNEIINHVLFADQLAPDIVIAHDGFNDLVYGVVCDTALLSQHQICYQHNLEEWSQILHATGDRPGNHQGEKIYAIKNTPHAILSAYLNRKKQLSDMVTAKGGKFIWGLQPFVESKAEMHPEEIAWKNRAQDDQRDLGNGFANAKMLLDALSGHLSKMDIDNVDLHRSFQRLGAEQHIFVDNVHLSPEGDDLIADEYFSFIRQRIENGRWFADA